MPLNAGDILRVSARMRGPQGQDIINVYHYRATNTITDTDADIMSAIANKLSNAYNEVEDQFPCTMSPVDIKIDVVDLVNNVETIVRNLGIVLWSATFSPSAVGAVYAPGVAVGLLLRTSVGKVFARKFIGPLMESTFGDHGKIGGEILTKFLLMTNQLLGAINLTGGQLEPGVLSKRLHGFAKFLWGEVAAEAFYQRRRSIRMGS